MRTGGSRASIFVLALALASACARRVDHGAPDAGARDAARLVDGGPIAAPRDSGPLDPVFEAAAGLDDEAVASIDPAALPSAPTPCRAPQLMRVAWVTDGDTITVEDPSTGAQERVRMLGVDTPEIGHDATTADECYGPEAHAFTAALAGHLVWLTFESGCLDRFDRTLAHVHVSAAPEGSWGRQLLRRGLASTLFVSPNRAFERLMTGDQAAARSELRGLWGACR